VQIFFAFESTDFDVFSGIGTSEGSRFSWLVALETSHRWMRSWIKDRKRQSGQKSGHLKRQTDSRAVSRVNLLGHVAHWASQEFSRLFRAPSANVSFRGFESRCRSRRHPFRASLQ